jgi:hypothetical protein
VPATFNALLSRQLLTWGNCETVTLHDPRRLHPLHHRLEALWACPTFVPSQAFVSAIFRSKATGLFQHGAK